MADAGEKSFSSRTRHEISFAILEAMDISSELKQVELPPGFGSARGSEHEVWFIAAERRVIKATHPGEFGRTFGPAQFATLDEYLKRISLINSVFGIDWIVLGANGVGRGMRVVSTQPAIRGSAAMLAEIRAFMEMREFVLYRTRFGDAWYRAQDNLLVSDAEPNNVISTADGLVPIDIMATNPTTELLMAAGI